jgi:Na+/melibiose symporter-like transporter
MVWPDGSWAFEGLVGNEATRMLAIGACILTAIGFVIGGIALFAAQAWWRPVVVAISVFSAVIFILFWDGQLQALANKGLFAILINLAILVALLVFRWPRLGV